MIAINERSFVGQAENQYAIGSILLQLMEVIDGLITAGRFGDVVVHSCLYGRKLSTEVDFHSWIHMKGASERDLRLFYITLVKNGPFIDHIMASMGIACSCRCGSEEAAFSGAAGMAHLGHVLASLTGAGVMSAVTVEVRGCSGLGTDKTIENFSTVAQVSRVDRIYAPTEKHEDHGWGTPMDLSINDAQQALRSGVIANGSVYAKVAGKYYIFRSDNAGGFHGYPIEVFKVPNKARTALD